VANLPIWAARREVLATAKGDSDALLYQLQLVLGREIPLGSRRDPCGGWRCRIWRCGPAVMNRHDDPPSGLAEPLQAAALDAFHGLLRQGEAMILRTEELQTSLIEAIPPTLVGPVMVALHSAWADLDARVQYQDSLRGDWFSRELWTQPTLQHLLRASYRLIASGIVYVVRHGSTASDVLNQLRQLMARLKAHSATRANRKAES